ncbi:MAG: adenine deaminase, partial [Bacteroidales bacterium]|nr:adenine deaminase [Bacteroidales bacterium]
ENIIEEESDSNQCILPGLIDAHIHIESSMLTPAEFARLAVAHGTVATVSDPHEIANVLGIDGVRFMIENGKQVSFKFYFGAPSCVPATSFESSGARLGSEDVEQLLKMDEIHYLSEMMNFPGVIYDDKEVMAKIQVAKKYHKPVDGHAPGLTGEEVKKYIQAGITTDHECFSIEEAMEKISYGMKVQIREGSAAKNFDTLIPLINSFPDKIMLCSDDKHPDDLVVGHINQVIKKAIKLGYDPLKVLKICTLNPIKHYDLGVGLLQKGDPADFIVIDNFDDFIIKATYIDGEHVAENGKSLLKSLPASTPNKFFANPVTEKDLEVKANGESIQILKALDGQLITPKLIAKAKIENGQVTSDIENDILKIVVLNRYKDSVPAIGFVNGFGLKRGAIASTVAHDSHNIIAIGTNDQEIAKAINLLIETKGGISLIDGNHQLHLPLPVAGIMSNEDGYKIAETYKQLNQSAKNLGSALHAPYMTLSFMALLVIPELKLSDKGLFDGTKFEFTSLFIN